MVLLVVAFSKGGVAHKSNSTRPAVSSENADFVGSNLAKIFSDKTVSIMADEDDRLDFGFADIS